MLASCPAYMVNHISSALGKPLRFKSVGSRSRPFSNTKITLRLASLVQRFRPAV